MRKLLSLLLCFIIIFGVLSGCGPGAPDSDDFSIVASIYPIYIALLNVTEGVQSTSVSLMTETATGCLHDYTLLPGDMKKLETCDLFVINGAGMESFLDTAMENRPDLPVLDTSDGVKVLTLNEESKEEYGSNSHVWVAMSQHIRQIENIVEGLCFYDPDNEVKYRENAERYIMDLEEMRVGLVDEVPMVTDEPVVAFHEAFAYFAEETGMHLKAIVEEEPDESPSPQRIQEIIDIIKENDIKVLAVSPGEISTSADIIVRETGCKLLEFDPIVSGESKTSAYLDAMRGNIDRLKEAYEGAAN